MTAQGDVLFNNSELSMAAYAILNTVDPVADQIESLKFAGMTEEQATQFAIRYPAVVAVQPDTASGFSATVFKTAEGQLTVAIRGTTPGVDLLEDISLTIYGAAYKQIIDMYNWWTKETTTAGQPIDQYSLVWGATEPAGSVLKMEETREAGGPHPYREYQWLVKTESVAETSGALAGLPDRNSVDVTGHSLGGHLASAFTALFSSEVDQTYTYNGPGFKSNDANTAFFVALGGVTPLIVADKVTRVQANDALPGESQIEAISNLHGGTPGTLVQIAIEDKGFIEGDIGTGNHSIVNTTDSLAIYNLLLKLDMSLDIKIFNSIFHSASHEVEPTRERLVDAIQRIFGIDQTELPPGDDYRNELYTAIYALQADASFKSLTGVTVQSSADITAGTAKTDFSAFISLYTLSPVYLAGADLNNTANRSLYNDWFAGKFSNDYLNDRSNLLHVLLTRNAMDENETDPASNETVYYDYTTDKEIFGSGGNESINPDNDTENAQVHFGSSHVDDIRGGENNDRFYGGAGNDTYHFSGSFGHDKIIDADGGTLKIDNETLVVTRIGKMVGGNKDGMYVFLDANGQLDPSRIGWSVMVNGSKAILTTKDVDGKFHTIQVDGFNVATNNFGITLRDAASWAVPAPNEPYVAHTNNSSLGLYETENIYFHRNRADADYYLNYSGTDARSLRIKELYNAAGFTNLDKSITYNAASFNDGSSSTHFEGGNANDLLQGKNQAAAGAFDILFGLGGNDIIIGEGIDRNNASTGDDADVLVGGHGDDQLYGGGGNDWLYATDAMSATYAASIGQRYNPGEDYGSFFEALYKNAFLYDPVTQTNTTTRLAMEKDGESNYLDGGEGNDWLVGGSFNDTLIGGNGSDGIYGGAGQDMISGGNNSAVQDDQIFGDSSIGSFGGFQTVNMIAPDILPLAGDYTRAYFFMEGDDNPATHNPQLRYDNDLALFNDVIDGGSGYDTIYGEIGSDVISGGDGVDTLFGDRFYNGWFIENWKPGQFQPLSSPYHGDDVIDGGAGNDRIIGGGGDDVLIGGDELVSVNYTDLIYGDLGIYTFDREIGVEDPTKRVQASDRQWWGNDTIFGGTGNDWLIGEGGADVIEGGDDNDRIYGDWFQTAQRISDADYKNYGGNDVISGGAGEDQIYGGAGDDTLTGGSGNDYLSGEEGSDTYVIRGGDGQDSISDSAGNNILTLIGTWLKEGAVQVVQSGNQTNIYTSPDQKNWITTYYLATFENRFQDGAGNALPLHCAISESGITLIDGIDYSISGAGKNLTLYNSNIDLSVPLSPIFLSDGSAILQLKTTAGGTIQLTISDWNGFVGLYNESQTVGFNVDASANTVDGIQLSGKSGNDTIIGGTADEILFGNAGNDVLNGGDGLDTASYLSASAAVQVNLTTGQSSGSAGNDSLINIENIIGSRFNDIFSGDSGSNVIDGGAGIDTVNYLSESVAVQVNLLTGTCTGAEGNDTLTNIENIIGSNHNDTLTGDDNANELMGGLGNDNLEGGSGNDLLIGSSGADTLNGGDGIDTASYSSATEAVQVNLATGLSAGAEGNDTLTDIENIVGSDYNDTLTGNDSANVLIGGLGNDSLAGGAGIDIYTFARGHALDTITSSDSSDIIQLIANPDNVYISRDVDDYLIRYKDHGYDMEFGVFEGIRIVGTSGVNTINFVDSNGNPVLDAMGNPVSWILDTGITLLEDNICTISMDASQGEIENKRPGYYALFDKNKLLNNDSLSAADGWEVIDVRPADYDDVPVYCGEFYGYQIIAFTPGIVSRTLEYFVQKNGSGPIYAQTIDVKFAEAAGGVVTLTGTDGIDLIDGIDAAQTIMDGGLGDDYMSGGYGNDTILHRFGDGNDVINMYESGYSEDSLILMGKNGSSVILDDVTFSQDDMDLLIHLDHGVDSETLRVLLYFQDMRDGPISSIKLFSTENAYSAWKADPLGQSALLLGEWIPDLNALKPDATVLRDNVDQIIINYRGLWQYQDNSDQNEVDATLYTSNSLLTNDQIDADAALTDNFDRLLQAMATVDASQSGVAPNQSSPSYGEYESVWLTIS